MSWYLKGEAGKTLDDTLREIHTLNIDAANLKFQSMDNDRLTWSAITEDATGAGTIVPDAGQVVELWKDGARKFRGHVLAPKVGSKRITIEAVGPWWWMTRIPLTSDQTDGNGNVAERVNYVFPTGSHKTKIETLINRAITNGVPMRLGTVDAIYDTPNMSLAEMNCSQSVAELMAWVPDAVLWFDHSDTSGDGTPIANVTRRGNMAATTYQVGVDAVIDIDITPRLDLEVAYSRLDYVTRNPTTGQPAWASQFSGVEEAGKKQIVTVSGPEIVDSLPNDDFDSIIVTTHTSPSVVLPLVNTEVRSYTETWSENFNTNVVSSGSNFAYTGPGGSSLGASYSTTALTFKSGYRGITFGADGLQSPPEWLIELLGLIKAPMSGMFWDTHPRSGSGSAYFQQRAELNALTRQDAFWFSGDSYYVARKSEQDIWQQPIAGPQYNGQIVYRPWSYDFLSPPAGLAAGLRDAQNWVPWEGPISLVGDEVTGDNVLSAKYNLTSALPACATMNTLARGLTHNIISGRTTIDLGAPARADFGSLTSRIRRQPRDNIVYL